MPLSRFATDTATLWTPGGGNAGDPFSDLTWTRTTIKVCRSVGGKTQTDSDGAEFTPMTTYWSESPMARGQKIIPGNIPDLVPPAAAETIRKADSWTPHPAQSQEWAGYTG